MPEQLKVTADGLNLRAQPDGNADVLTVMRRGDLVELLGTSPDGYWRNVRFGAREGWAASKHLRQVGGAEGAHYPWMDLARSEIGVSEVAGAGDNPRITTYLRSTTLAAQDAANDETPWCSAFVNWCVETSGYAGTDSAWARSWLNWGQPTSDPTPGCIAVFTRGETNGHVAFYLGREGDQIEVLGGNQSNSVSVARYPVGRLLGFRIPA